MDAMSKRNAKNAHLVEPTHSAAFWRLVAGYPEAERAKGYLEGYLQGQGAQPGSGADEDDVEEPERGRGA